MEREYKLLFNSITIKPQVMVLKKTKQYFAILTCWLISVLAIADQPATSWHSIMPGLEYTQLQGFANYPNGTVHAFRINLKDFNFRLAFTQQYDQSLDLQDIMQQQHAIIATNGGFFTPEMKSLGLRIDNGQELVSIRPVNWWGIFYTQANKAYIVTRQQFTPKMGADFAIQAGPLLIINGNIPNKLKPMLASRTALGINSKGQVILLATENLILSTQDLAQVMAAPESAGGLNCMDAINLDGGGSTQMYTQLKNLNVQVPGTSLVADAILIVPRS